MAQALARPHESKIYSQFAHLYDRIFTGVFYPRIARVISRLGIPPGARVLEVGVGTGLSLSTYPEHCEMTGVDISTDMLERAETKIADQGWRHITLMEMDAQRLSFPDNCFDYVTSFHVVSVVPEPQKMMSEMVRVCRPGGTIVVINHFRSERPLLARLVDRLDPITCKLGWSTTLRLSDLIGNVPLRLKQRYKTSPRSLFTVMIGEKLAPDKGARVVSLAAEPDEATSSAAL
jgi:phosphatidylethanolamine/phosphatidyl-N-methylethanolamine N-methyltransferase